MSAAAAPGVPGLGPVEQLVLRGDGLTTTSLEILTGTTVTTAVRAHWRLALRGEWSGSGEAAGAGEYAGPGPGGDPRRWAWLAGEHLDVGPDDELLVRELDLVGASGATGLGVGAGGATGAGLGAGDRVLATATLVAVLGVLPEALAHRLGTTDEPIGRMLAAHGLPVRRELRRWGLREAGEHAARLGVDPPTPVPARTYRMVTTGPLCVITEWFRPDVLAAVAPAVTVPRRAPGRGRRSTARSVRR